MTLYTYFIPFDNGAAPNPFGGICTLAICKPVIRRNAKAGDWVVGTGSVDVHAYLMQQFTIWLYRFLIN